MLPAIKIKPRLGGVSFIVRRVLNHRSPSEAHCLLVGFVVLVAVVVVVAVAGLIVGVVADQNHRVYHQASA